MNGTPKGFFQSKRGLRQGDPLSPYLFIVMQEVLSRLIKHAADNGRIHPFFQARGTLLVSHLMYTDDIVIFANGSKRSIKGLMQVLNSYESWSGQVLSKEKSAIFFSKHILMSRKRSILRISGFSEGSFPFKYLGVPIVNGRLKAFDFTDLLGKVKKKIAGWKMKLLSVGGRTVLLRHVLSSMATHLLAVLHVPKIVIRELNKLLSSFFWGHSLWADFFKGKYVRDKHLSLLVPNKGTSVWKSIVNSIPDVLHNSKWLVREGNLSFWYDNWEEGGPLHIHYPVIDHSMIKIKECRIENGWDIPLLERLVGQQKANDVYQFLARRNEGQDVLVWMKENNGSFSTKSAWDCIRIQAPPLNWAHWIWHNHIPKKMSIMMWKASNNCLSVDAKIQMAGIPMVSKCNCCVLGNMEDLNHVLCSGEFARQLWHMAAVQLGVHMSEFRTWQEQIDFWFR
ncbi:hypothetical protein F2P56_032333 [Juglans regia]|uniref:Reverse transcriptase domain-containing protein n=2 Tax=Juglans regia TaxID=51240 RepID=A0A833U9W7_JUGRE|nr:uncharacterized protein LOC109002005 [Juglans regia]KAF5446730.1 hypothetical protein F2P56_032333 [Juglans regia]